MISPPVRLVGSSVGICLGKMADFSGIPRRLDTKLAPVR